jgi:uncharacterized protein
MRPYLLDPGTVLFGKTRRRVLGLLFGHPDQSFYVRDIVRRSGAAQGAIARELDALLGAGLLWRREDGRNVYYQANKEAPVFPELARLVRKTTWLADLLREALSPLAGRIDLAAVCGSAARGQLKSERAIDLLVIGDVPLPEVVDALRAVKERLDRPVKPAVHPKDEFRTKSADDPHLGALVSGPLLFVIGEAEDLHRLRGRDRRPLRRRRRLGSSLRGGRP